MLRCTVSKTSKLVCMCVCVCACVFVCVCVMANRSQCILWTCTYVTYRLCYMIFYETIGLKIDVLPVLVEFS